AVTQDDVGDDLLEARILLHGGTRSVATLTGDELQARAQPCRSEAIPARSVRQPVARHDEDVLLAHRGIASRRSRALRSRSATSPVSGPPGRSSSASHASSAATSSRTRSAMAGPFV